jgi:hypothetical protein
VDQAANTLALILMNRPVQDASRFFLHRVSVPGSQLAQSLFGFLVEVTYR